MFRSVSACCIAHTSTSKHLTRLPTFAVWPAFPTADYYGGSVALSLAACRRSRVPHAVDVQGGLGARFVPLRSLEATVWLPGTCRGRGADPRLRFLARNYGHFS